MDRTHPVVRGQTVFRNLFEGWHLIILILVILVLFGGKRLPDAARGLGRSLRIFKSEVKQMQDDDKPRAATPTDPDAIEGRVVDGGSTRASTPGEQRRDV
jgi:sec-independent protein translocase protein TatA